MRDSSCMPQLKLLAADALRMMTDAASRLTLRIDSRRIDIYAEDSLIQVGSLVEFLPYIQKQFLDKLLSQFIAAATVAGVAWFTSNDPKTAAATFVAVVVALFARTSLEALNFRKRVDYVDA